MDIRARINARKICLAYLYQHCFFCHLEKNDKTITESLFASYIFLTDNEKYDVAKEALKEKFITYEYLSTPEEIKEFAEIFYDARTPADIDYDYVLAITKDVKIYEAELIAQVNTYAVSFAYDEMDTIDQAIFLLGFAEWKILETPKNILLNELIELAKRYSDD
ncbi:MAG: transcription antitermination factor NusB [bacterium]